MAGKSKVGPKEEQRFLRQVDWNLFRQFHEIIRAGSVSAAARQLNTHQPSLSLALKRLEDQIGVALCRRTAQGVELTPAGKAVMQQAADMVESIRMVPHLAAQAAKRIDGSLKIGMISDIIAPEFDEALSSLIRRHPNVKLTIEIATWREVLEAVVSGDFDIGVTYESEGVPQLTYEPMIREQQQIYCGRSHPLYGHRIRNPATLAGERFILSAADEPKDVERFRIHFDLGKNTTAYADDLTETLRLIRLGAGIGFLPTVLAEPYGDKLWGFLPESLMPSYFIYLITQNAWPISTPTQLFQSEVLRRLRAKPELT
jgi:DNA-binding transcriptional LysR family regulator